MTKKQPTKKPKPKTSIDYEQEIGELTHTLQRLQAEFENYKKRVVSERETIMKMAKQSVLTDLLPALDNFDRAATHLPSELKDNAWAQGMSYVGTQLEQILDDMGVSKFEAVAGEQFDESCHEALEHIVSEQPDGTIAEQITPGYEVDGIVVRPAVVKVAHGKDSESIHKPQSKEVSE